jgi:hypothetical protein
MPESTEFDPTDRGTQRPNVKPLKARGTHFQPMDCPDFDLEIRLPEHASPIDPISIFLLYYPPQIIEMIATYTNSCPREPRDPTQPYSRPKSWYPTCAKEIYTYLAFRIYMTLYPLNQISDYWDIGYITPYHHITQSISRNRFQELHMRYRVGDPKERDIYNRVFLRSLICYISS